MTKLTRLWTYSWRDKLRYLGTLCWTLILLTRYMIAYIKFKGPVSVIHLDVTGLTKLNLERGWEAGDAVIRDLEGFLTGALPQGVRLVRSSGDVFSVLCPSSISLNSPLEGKRQVEWNGEVIEYSVHVEEKWPLAKTLLKRLEGQRKRRSTEYANQD